MRYLSRSRDVTIIGKEVVLALSDNEGLSRKEAVSLERRACQMLAVATVAEVLQGRSSFDREVDGRAEAMTSVSTGR